MSKPKQKEAALATATISIPSLIKTEEQQRIHERWMYARALDNKKHNASSSTSHHKGRWDAETNSIVDLVLTGITYVLKSNGKPGTAGEIEEWFVKTTHQVVAVIKTHVGNWFNKAVAWFIGKVSLWLTRLLPW